MIYYNDIDPYCCAVLRKNIERGNLPGGNVDERDIRTIDASELMGYQHIHLFAGIGGFPYGIGHLLDGYRIVTGGFPCQPHSLAGERKGSEDERDLWPETFHIIRRVRPDYAIGENVLGILSSERGRFFTGILRDLASIGYDARWQVLQASDFGAPHQRARVFLVAYPTVARCKEQYRATWLHNGFEPSGTGYVAYPVNPRRTSTRDISAEPLSRWQKPRWQPGAGGVGRSGAGDVAYTNGERCEECDVTPCDGTTGLDTRNVSTFRVSGASQSAVCRSADGISRRLDEHRWPVGPGQAQATWEPPRVVTDQVSNRVARLKALGNAIVPQCAQYIALCILASEQVESDEVA